MPVPSCRPRRARRVVTSLHGFIQQSVTGVSGLPAGCYVERHDWRPALMAVKAGVTTLGYALLGLLAAQPLSGYDLARKLKRPVGFFWPARHSQIYPELALLQAEGLVTHQVVEQTDRPDKKLYQITDSGRAAVRTW